MIITTQQVHSSIIAIIFPSLLSLASAQTPSIYNSSTEYRYSGCYTETMSLPFTNEARALNNVTHLVDFGNKTPDMCLDFCDSESGATYKYAGLEYSR